MQYQTPTNKSELLSTIKEIYHYYRVQRIEAPQIELVTLDLPTLNFNEKTEEELIEEAKKLISASHQREKNKSIEETKEKLASLEILIASANQATQSLIDKITLKRAVSLGTKSNNSSFFLSSFNVSKIFAIVYGRILPEKIYSNFKSSLSKEAIKSACLW